jgi:hypothetical protein
MRREGDKRQAAVGLELGVDAVAQARGAPCGRSETEELPEPFVWPQLQQIVIYQVGPHIGIVASFARRANSSHSGYFLRH